MHETGRTAKSSDTIRTTGMNPKPLPGTDAIPDRIAVGQQRNLDWHIGYPENT
tara:strand:- start:274 stop:432 length:159 start_codon:yes stop_codon:yes gene_type:complete